jgi:predicted lipoprotein with Yx(FWY)xxD motif
MGSARPRTIVAAVAVLIVAAVAAAIAVGATSTSSSAAQVNVRQTALGKILVDSNGHTLYLYGPDKKGKSACYGQCATFWPPLVKTSAKLAGSGVEAALLTSTKRTNGKIQLVYNGHPLYRFAEDKKAGQTNGQGLNAAGGLWWVLAPSGKPIEKKTSSPPPATTTTGSTTTMPGYGYG